MNAIFRYVLIPAAISAPPFLLYAPLYRWIDKHLIDIEIIFTTAFILVILGSAMRFFVEVIYPIAPLNKIAGYCLIAAASLFGLPIFLPSIYLIYLICVRKK